MSGMSVAPRREINERAAAYFFTHKKNKKNRVVLKNTKRFFV